MKNEVALWVSLLFCGLALLILGEKQSRVAMALGVIVVLVAGFMLWMRM